ncbi:MAG: type II toxin-antitoxin system HipA family toxin [Desulfobulbaceae bacterium]|nr:type II toxin-antitoxin system HipA family toxin [Desulfobulbaceae bacterium]
MSTVAEVRLWGRTIGAVALEEDAQVASFEYDPAFARSGIEIAPLTMPLAPRVYSFPALAKETFHGLPGLLADSLPDRFGNALINAWLATQGRSPDSFNAVERLCYTGRRGMGALEYLPAIGPRARQASRIRIDHLVALASRILIQRNDLSGSLDDDGMEDALKDILRVGTSAGGARAKAVIAWNPSTNEVRSGQVPADSGFEHWLLKFDGVSGNRDKELEDPKGFGVIEYAYYRMARDAGITMSQCRLLEENGRSHFMTRRFDRSPGGEKIHMQSLGALAHFDFNLAGGYSYEQAQYVARQLSLEMRTIEELYRRMVFNILARNQDDHVKNIAFLMDKTGRWSLAPAFDLTYSFQPTGRWTSTHQMTLNGKRDNFTLEDFRACAGSASMKRGRAETILKEVHQVVAHWPKYADEVGVSADWRDKIARTHRLEGIL